MTRYLWIIGLFCLVTVRATESEYHNSFVFDPALSLFSIMTIEKGGAMVLAANVEKYFPSTRFALKAPLMFGLFSERERRSLVAGTGFGGKVFLAKTYNGYMFDFNFAGIIHTHTLDAPDPDEFHEEPGISGATLWRLEFGKVWHFKNVMLQLSAGGGWLSIYGASDNSSESILIPSVTFLFGFPFSWKSLTRIKVNES